MDQLRFTQKIEKAQSHVKQILGQSKNPTLATNVNHTYEDKYLLSEFICNTAIMSQMTCLSHLGISEDQLLLMKEWADSNQTVTMQFSAHEKCHFIRSETKEQDSKTKEIIQGVYNLTRKVVTTIKEYIWNVEVSWEINVYHGTDIKNGFIVSGRKGDHELITTNDKSPYPKIQSPSIVKSIDMTWLLQKLSIMKETGDKKEDDEKGTRQVIGCPKIENLR
mmetsp:Transcript_28070/g.33246  ORF Transcript_28070/g.33246 Transcript_28070/m.33246 type:complete len:221 (+) Transcript_28070:73-735(+)